LNRNDQDLRPLEPRTLETQESAHDGCAETGTVTAGTCCGTTAADADRLPSAHVPGATFAKGAPSYTGDSGFVKTVTGMRNANLTGDFFSLVAHAPLIALTASASRRVDSMREPMGRRSISDS